MGIKHKVNEKFFEKWSSNMAYVLGYIYADGSLDDSPYMRGKYFHITSVDRDSIDRIKKWLGSEHKITNLKSHFIGSKKCFKLRIGSHKIYDDLFKLGLYPNKSLTIKFPKIPNKYFWHFIRGYFDGDGCVFLERRKSENTGRLIIKRIRIIFTSGSKLFLDGININFIKNGIKDGRIYKNRRAYQLMYNTEDSIKVFKLMYKNTGKNSFFMRKFKIFNKYFELRPSSTDRSVKNILKKHFGHVVKQLTQRSAKSRYASANLAVASVDKILPE